MGARVATSSVRVFCDSGDVVVGRATCATANAVNNVKANNILLFRFVWCLLHFSNNNNNCLSDSSFFALCCDVRRRCKASGSAAHTC